jgi:hypothetical protein
LDPITGLAVRLVPVHCDGFIALVPEDASDVVDPSAQVPPTPSAPPPTPGSSSCTTAAPSPAPLTSEGKLLVISGDDGLRAHLNGPDHPGFPTDILAYDPAADRWSGAGESPFSRATAATVAWRGGWAVASGERKPGYRSPEVWWLEAGAKTSAGKP